MGRVRVTVEVPGVEPERGIEEGVGRVGREEGKR